MIQTLTGGDVSPFKVQWRQTVTFKSIQCHPGLIDILNF